LKTLLPSLIFGGALALLALAPGCASTPERTPRSTQTIVLSPGREARAVKMELVSAIRVVLPGPDAGAGLGWVIASNNTRVLDQMGPMKVVPASGAPGSAATTVVSFYSLKPGRSAIRFFLVRPNESEAVPAASCTLLVEVED
jgi:hypothetical protein